LIVGARRTRISGVTHALFRRTIAPTVLTAIEFTNGLTAIITEISAVTYTFLLFADTIGRAGRSAALLIDAIFAFVIGVANARSCGGIAFAVGWTAGFADRTTRITVTPHLL